MTRSPLPGVGRGASPGWARAGLAPLSLLALVCLLALCAPGSARATKRSVPSGYIGVQADGPLVDGGLSAAQSDREYDQMVATGVETVRAEFSWDQGQPYASDGLVPADRAAGFVDFEGVPTNYGPSDAIVRRAAARGLAVLPVVVGTPNWARVAPYELFSPPQDAARYASFIAALVKRYGPGGTFWAANPGLTPMPIRSWQIWNEPAGGATPDSGSSFWVAEGVRFETRYIEMLRAAHGRIKALDPGAHVVLAGLYGASWLALHRIYQVGGRGLFDSVAVNIFTRKPSDVLRAVRYVRSTMLKNGDRSLPVMVTELTWPTAAGRVTRGKQLDYDVTPAKQAANLTAAMKLLLAHRGALHLAAVMWDDWVSRDANRTAHFDFAGLRHVVGGRVQAKPAQAALRAFARRVEGCTKRARADRCAGG